MKKFLILLIIIFSGITANAQPGKRVKTDSLLVIDSLFRYQFIESVQRNGEHYYITYDKPVYDSTRQVQIFRMVTDTIKFSGGIDTLIHSFTNKFGIEAHSFYRLVRLMQENGIVEMSYAGPGDCKYCSTYLFMSSVKAVVILNPTDDCFPENCYWRPFKARLRKLDKQVFLIRNL